ncbi:MAG: RNA polymerase sigma-54 factor [Planctomycetes bacterium]|nr:RNA polymerase sigma-54 factor [Planctomycetota bacterium]
MRIGLHQSARLEQRLVQSPQMIQAMKILQMSALDLEERVEQELEENPFLEREEESGPTSGEGDVSGVLTAAGEAGAPASEAPAPADEGEDTRLVERDRLENMLDTLELYDREYGDGTRLRPISDEAADRRLEALRNTPDSATTLAESLTESIAFLPLTELERGVATFLVHSLDERGYLRDSLEELAAAAASQLAAPISLDEIEVALFELRRLAHPGLGAGDLRECLLLQVDAAPEPDPLLRVLVSEHLPDIEANRLPHIVRATGHDMEAVKAGVEQIRHLDPAPGASFGETQADVIYPDVLIEEDEDGQFVVIIDRERTPRLRLSPSYRRLLNEHGNDPETQAWVKKRIESARWFLDAVVQRQSTLRRITEAIVRRQQLYLEEGVRGLRPLRMQDIADEIGVHISTISRAVAGKYAQTPRGVVPLKFFFTSGTVKETGGSESQAGVQQRVAEVVAGEDTSRPLSDDQISEQLQQRFGIKIARRTVTKYRKILKIPSSSQRREY